MKHQSLKCVLNEGMPQYKNPFEKGKLILQFIVNFPDEIDHRACEELEKILPPRPEYIIPDDADEVRLSLYHFLQVWLYFNCKKWIDFTV